jgi:hypothetical protein
VGKLFAYVLCLFLWFNLFWKWRLH